MAFAAIKYGVDKFRTELVNSEGNDIAAGTWFNIIVKILIPIEFVALLGWWFRQEVYLDGRFCRFLYHGYYVLLFRGHGLVC